MKTQGQKGLNNDILTNPSGFAGIDGVFRFRPEGTNQRGLAVMRVTPQGGQVIAPAPKTFGNLALLYALRKKFRLLLPGRTAIERALAGPMK